MERYAPSVKDLAPRDMVSRAMTVEIREGRGVGKKKDHIFLHLDHLDPKILHERLPGISESAKIFAGVDLTRQPIPVLPTVHYNMGGIPTNYHGEVVIKKNGDPDVVVPGLMALGEAACVSVHGANRLGSNSLIDLFVFGRAAGIRAAEIVTAGAKQPELPADSADRALERLDGFRFAKGAIPTAELRLRMQTVMQNNCAVYRTGETLDEGSKLIHEVWAARDQVGVTDRSMIWNSDLVETLEFDNLIIQAVVTMDGAGNRTEMPRRPCPRGLPAARRRQLDEAHIGFDRPRRTQGDDRLPAGAQLHHDQRDSLYRAQSAGVLMRRARAVQRRPFETTLI